MTTLEQVVREIVREEISRNVVLNPPTTLTLPEAASYVKRTESSLRNLVDRRRVPFTKAGGRLMFIKEELDKWLIERR